MLAILLIKLKFNKTASPGGYEKCIQTDSLEYPIWPVYWLTFQKWKLYSRYDPFYVQKWTCYINASSAQWYREVRRPGFSGKPSHFSSWSELVARIWGPRLRVEISILDSSIHHHIESVGVGLSRSIRGFRALHSDASHCQFCILDSEKLATLRLKIPSCPADISQHKALFLLNFNEYSTLLTWWPHK